MLSTEVQRSVRLNKKKKSTNTSPYPDEVIDRLARAFYPAILACWNSEEGQREFAAWQAEQAHHAPSNEKQSVPDGERPVVHIAIVCGFNRKFYKQCNSQQLVCDMQFTVVANESNRECRGAPCFCFVFDLLIHGSDCIRSNTLKNGMPEAAASNCRHLRFFKKT